MGRMTIRNAQMADEGVYKCSFPTEDPISIYIKVWVHNENGDEDGDNDGDYDGDYDGDDDGDDDEDEEPMYQSRMEEELRYVEAVSSPSLFSKISAIIVRVLKPVVAIGAAFIP